MSKTFYITTPLYYVNAAPHIGHSYTNIAADVLARYQRLKGREVFLLTGTDEHGQKIEQAAASASLSPQTFADRAVEHFLELWRLLSISYDDFIRTTQPRHVQTVQVILERLRQAGKLKLAPYRGWYCTPDETFWTDAELGLSSSVRVPPQCPACNRSLEPLNEQGWHLPLRDSQPWLKSFVKGHPKFVRPRSRYNELLALLEKPLPEALCITRPRSRVSWGITVPFSPDHVTYVWFDALLNYVSVPGIVNEPKRFASMWPADVHLIGKDILRHHAVYWPVMLHALGLADDDMPCTILAHGWWTIGSQKMSKSIGNIVDPTVVISGLLKDQPFAADVYRYFLLREIPFGQDGNFSEEAINTRLSADLANSLGNLVNRSLAMVGRYCGGRVPPLEGIGCALEDERLKKAAVGLPVAVDAAMEEYSFSEALEAIMRMVDTANRYIEASSPWILAKDAAMHGRLGTVLRMLLEAIRIVAIIIEPFMPSVAKEIWRQLGCDDSPRRFQDASRWRMLKEDVVIGEHPVLFPRKGEKGNHS